MHCGQEWRRKYWATRLSVRSFARTAHSFACSGLLASLAPSAGLTSALAYSLWSLPRSWESEFLMSQNDLVLSHSGMVPQREGDLTSWSWCSLVKVLTRNNQNHNRWTNRRTNQPNRWTKHFCRDTTTPSKRGMALVFPTQGNLKECFFSHEMVVQTENSDVDSLSWFVFGFVSDQKEKMLLRLFISSPHFSSLESS